MLVLTRKEDQAIHIGSDVTIRVLSIGRGRIRLGIDAPTETPVRRAELLDKQSSACGTVSTEVPFEGLTMGGGAAIDAIIELELRPT